MITQLGFESVSPVREKIIWRDYVRTCSADEAALLRGIIKLYLGGRAFDADASYSTGRIWRNLPAPHLKFDLAPQARGVIGADAQALPLANESLNSIFFDPPFVVGPPAAPGIMRDRFSCFQSVAQMFAVYQNALGEFYRVLKPRGILVFKCQDVVDSGKQVWSEFEIMRRALDLGFTREDKLILLRENVVMSPNMEHQQHARKNHCYFLVFRKVVKP